MSDRGGDGTDEPGETGGADRTADRMRERGAASTAKLWILLEADRWLLTAGLLAVVFCSLVAVGVASPVSLRTLADQSDPIGTLFQALVTAIVTGVTLVVTIAQLVLSQELGSAGDQRDRMEGSMDFRDEVADHLETPVSPAEPSSFLRVLVDATGRHAAAAVDAVEFGHDPSVRDQVTAFAHDVERNATDVSNRLADAEFGTFGVISVALDYDYSPKINEGRRLQVEHDGALSDDVSAALDSLVESLALFGSAREHIKDLYFQWELSNLSRTILYSAVPALIVAIAAVLFLGDPSVITGTTLGIDNLLLVVSAAATVAVAPFLLLVAFVLRIITVTKRTLAMGPFVLRETSGPD